MNAKRSVIGTLLAVGLLGGGGVASAYQVATPVASPGGVPPLPEGCSVVADGLINPRYVAVGDDGSIYISEAGTGGNEKVGPPMSSEPTPGAMPSPGASEEGPPESGTRGTTGQVTMIAPDGSRSVIASGLPSYAFGPESTGPAGIAVSGGQVVLAIGGAGPASAYLDELPNENSVVSIDPATGDVTQLANIGAYEREYNPDPYNIDSNLYGLAVGSDGTIYVNDAGGNTTYRVPEAGGEPTVVVVHPGLPIPADQAPPGGNPERGGANELDPVPTDVKTTANGGLLVSYLSGGPFPPGAAKVVAVAADGTLSDVATGLTMAVGMAAGPDGQLYVSEISTNFLGEVPAPGNVVRINGDGSHDTVIDGLMLPNGIAFDQNGDMLVVANTLSMGPPNGQLLRCEMTSSMSDANTATVVLSEMRFTPAELSIKADTDVTLRLVNKGVATHDFSIAELGIDSRAIPAGGEVELTVNVPAGDYSFFCNIPGHRLAGMNGVLHVTA